jgi:hypothetical protein
MSLRANVTSRKCRFMHMLLCANVALCKCRFMQMWLRANVTQPFEHQLMFAQPKNTRVFLIN